MSTAEVVGRLVSLWRYPVKSMAAEALPEADVSWFGVPGDRRWAFIRPGTARNGFPWLTLRQRADLNDFRPFFTEPGNPNGSTTMVCTPSGAELEVADPKLADELGEGVRVIKQDRGIFDTMPLSLITTQTIAGLGLLAGSRLGAERFRPNFLIEGTGQAEFPEDSWVGKQLRIGELRVRIDGRDRRCAVVNVDPSSGRRDSAILRAITREREACLGVYASTVRPGKVRVGDPVLLEG